MGQDDGAVFRDTIPEHHAPKTEPAREDNPDGQIPDFCQADCERLRRSELPGLLVVLGCEQYRADTDWTWSRLDGMRQCPLA